MTRKTSPQHARAAFALRPCAHAAAVCIALLSAQAATAQTEAPVNLQRVEVTGSSIKRIQGESALPVETIKREDIEKAGVTTAAELLQKITSNVGGLTDGGSISDQSGAQRGFNGANLRGLGVSSTLVLLNGRRLANFATPGDNSGVDLNNIPSGAIERVDVLKDGASAIYGTDAMGGVINFITRKDYQGGDVSVYALTTQQGGAAKKTFTASAGFGDLGKDGFNVFAALDVQRLDSLSSSQRSFIQEYDLVGRLPGQLSSNVFPGNVDLTSGQLTALNNFVLANPGTALKGTGPNGTWVPVVPGSSARRVNFAKRVCTGGANPNALVPLGPGGTEGCSYNYMLDSEIYPKADKANFVSRATFQLAPDHQLFAEALLSKSQTEYAAAPATSGRIRTSAGIRLPAALQSVTGVITPVDFRFRLSEAGKRVSSVDSEATRLVVGAVGVVGDWDYDTAINYSVNKATDSNVSGWVSNSKLLAGMQSGAYVPFVPSTPASQSFMDSIRLDGAARISEGTSTSLDGKLTRALSKLGGGDLMLAIGAEIRRENTEFRATDVLKSNDVQGDRSASASAQAANDLLLKDSSNTRTVKGAYAELIAPFTKQWEGQFALRHDRYDGVFNATTNATSTELSTTNPKIGLSFKPDNTLLARASYGTGFRAPTIAEMFQPARVGIFPNFSKDPVSGEVSQFPADRSSNPNLKPETSQQFSVGLVFEPSKNWDGSLDYWSIRKSDIISNIGSTTIFENPEFYNNPNIVKRFSDGFVDTVFVKKENRGQLNTSGIDVALRWRGDSTAMGRFGVGMAGTLVTQFDYNTDPRAPMVSGLGVFRDDNAVQRWRHKLNLDWDMGAIGLTLSNTYLSGYRDENPKGLSAPAWDNRDVEAYSLWDVTGNYKFTKNFRVRAGVLNILDTAPPFTNQSRYFQVTWDSTYADPRGRSYYVSANYSFK